MSGDVVGDAAEKVTDQVFAGRTAESVWADRGELFAQAFQIAQDAQQAANNLNLEGGS